jgi:hypothetical protein
MTATLLPKTENNSPLAFLLSLKEYYLGVEDPTDYQFVRKYIPGGWKQWQELNSDPTTAVVIGFWRDELHAKLRSKSLSRIQEAAEGETRDALSANKYLYEIFSPKDKVGRPSNEKIKQEAHRLVEDKRISEEAYERVFTYGVGNKPEVYNAQEEIEEEVQGT